VVGSWVQVVKLLQNGTKDPASCADASLNDRVRTLVNKLKVLPPCPRSVWTALLQQQVCTTPNNTVSRYSNMGCLAGHVQHHVSLIGLLGHAYPAS
jgi:hypothetical protein